MSPKSHLPMISVVNVEGISIVAHNRSLTANAMMYRLVVDRRFGFLYAAIQTRLFPVMLMIHNTIHTLASVMITGKPRLGKSKFDILSTKKCQINDLEIIYIYIYINIQIKMTKMKHA